MIKEKFKKIILPLVVVSAVSLMQGCIIGQKLTQKRYTNIVEVQKLHNEKQTKRLINIINGLDNNIISIKGEVKEGAEGYKFNEGDKFWELTDGSWFLVNESKGKYIFQPINLGDWEYRCNNIVELNNLIQTYIENTNLNIEELKKLIND